MKTNRGLAIAILVVILIVATILVAGCEAAIPPPPDLSRATNPFNNEATWTAILSLFVPLIAALLMQTGWTKQANSLIALGATVAFAVLDAWYFNKLDPTNLPATILAILVGALTTYKTIWAPLGVIDWWADLTTLDRFKFIGPRAAGKPRGLPW